VGFGFVCGSREGTGDDLRLTEISHAFRDDSCLSLGFFAACFVDVWPRVWLVGGVVCPECGGSIGVC